MAPKKIYIFLFFRAFCSFALTKYLKFKHLRCILEEASSPIPPIPIPSLTCSTSLNLTYCQMDRGSYAPPSTPPSDSSSASSITAKYASKVGRAPASLVPSYAPSSAPSVKKEKCEAVDSTPSRNPTAHSARNSSNTSSRAEDREDHELLLLFHLALHLILDLLW